MGRAVLSCLIGSALWRIAALGIVLLGFAADSSIPVTAGASSLEARRQPMKFGWVACDPNCGAWISAVGIVTVDTPKDFEDFARDRNLGGATVVLDSSGGSVNDAITLGRRWRKLGLATTVGISVPAASPLGNRPRIDGNAYCESMCVFLLLSGQTRFVPEGARVRVHQIWMGDRAEDARAASYTAQDMSIVERDIGRLAKFTFEMGGTGDLLSLALSVPPWEDLHELSRAELRDTNLITTQAIADLLPGLGTAPAKTVASAGPKPVQDRFASQPAPATKTAEALPTGGTAPAQPGH
ncbi:hypothetical protein DNX69_00210 [Rhodopseudomonas palustris]|uniref:Uncharacterized protein n=1 Tax=Rhodopseudomonas palustris TaxID=1076 RepID=A0A323UMU8_RHOPL|nr:hypothetical protein [Rhodopseudomonas palustris]PZA13894.1 hypothetical protein DNX69_00210 [Rhodopseudomonas palustris]